MKAARFHEFGGPEVLRYEDVPDPQLPWVCPALASEHQEKSKRTLRHLVTSIDLIKLNKVDSEDDLLNLSRNVLKIAYLRPQGALSLVKYVVKAPNRGNFLKLPDSVAVYDQFISILR